MSLQQKIENEIAILRGLIAQYKRSTDPESIFVWLLLMSMGCRHLSKCMK